jgi:hypothetical protein
VKRAAVLLALALVGCGVPAGTAGPGAPDEDVAEAGDRTGDFALVVAIDEGILPAGEPLTVETTLTYLGDEASVVVWGSGGGVVSFDVRRLDAGFDVQAVTPDDCERHAFERDRPMEIPFQKSGSWDPQDPGDDAIRAYLADPQLRLPAGRWQITARARFWLGDSCGPPEASLVAAVTFTTQD